MSDFRNYDPEFNILIFSGIRLRMYVDDSHMAAEREVDTFTKQVGVLGDVTRTRNRNRSGTVTATLQHTSPTNTLLSNIMLEDELFGLGVRTLMITEIAGSTLLSAQHAWIKRAPNFERGAEVAPVVWEFDVASLDVFIGGTLV